ncbi:MAG: hypothetical protein JWR85_1085 [Marmoricola sp.]|nr:hypothetical protein [Marmoricola sp.]
MTISAQLQRLIDLGVHELAQVDVDELSSYVVDLPDDPEAILVVSPLLVPAAKLATLLRLNARPGFVVVDMADLADFEPIESVTVPDRPLYLVQGLDRGDEMANWSPDEALPAIAARGRSPVTVSEGISWLLQEPGALERNHCFMTIGSRMRKGAGLDARTPAIWISGGTGRDGRENRGAPKIGWCWAGNRHTWLGFASTAGRSPGRQDA